MNRTNNYNLCQWEADDKIQRVDFNGDNAKIDGALAGLARSKADTGDGKAERVIHLGFTPKAVYVCGADSITYVSGNSGIAYRGGLAVPGAPATAHGYPIVEIVSGGFKVFYTEVKPNNVSTNHYGANTTNVEFHYIAFK